MRPADEVKAVLADESIEGFLAEDAANAALKVDIPVVYLNCGVGPQQVADELVLVVGNWPFDLVDQLQLLELRADASVDAEHPRAHNGCDWQILEGRGYGLP